MPAEKDDRVIGLEETQRWFVLKVTDPQPQEGEKKPRKKKKDDGIMWMVCSSWELAETAKVTMEFSGFSVEVIPAKRLVWFGGDGRR